MFWNVLGSEIKEQAKLKGNSDELCALCLRLISDKPKIEYHLRGKDTSSILESSIKSPNCDAEMAVESQAHTCFGGRNAVSFAASWLAHQLLPSPARLASNKVPLARSWNRVGSETCLELVHQLLHIS
jgi:hypothetical protein